VEAEADISEFRMAQGQVNAVSQPEADNFGFFHMDSNTAASNTTAGQRRLTLSVPRVVSALEAEYDESL
jgi:hypothetical protein